MRLTRLSREAVKEGAGQRIECIFLKKTSRKSKRKDSGIQVKSSKASKSNTSLASASVPNRKTKKRRRSFPSDEEQDSDFIVKDDVTDARIEGDPHNLSDRPGVEIYQNSSSVFSPPHPVDDGDDDDNTWTFTMADVPVPPTKRRRTKVLNSGPASDDEVVVLSD